MQIPFHANDLTFALLNHIKISTVSTLTLLDISLHFVTVFGLALCFLLLYNDVMYGAESDSSSISDPFTLQGVVCSKPIKIVNIWMLGHCLIFCPQP